MPTMGDNAFMPPPLTAPAQSPAPPATATAVPSPSPPSAMSLEEWCTFNGHPLDSALGLKLLAVDWYPGSGFSTQDYADAGLTVGQRRAVEQGEARRRAARCQSV